MRVSSSSLKRAANSVRWQMDMIGHQQVSVHGDRLLCADLREHGKEAAIIGVSVENRTSINAAPNDMQWDPGGAEAGSSRQEAGLVVGRLMSES